MRRRVKVEDLALEAIVRQLDGSPFTADEFVSKDLVRELHFLAEFYDSLPLHGSGRRHTQQEQATVAFFHIFAALNDDGVVIVYHVDIWDDDSKSPPDTC